MFKGRYLLFFLLILIQEKSFHAMEKGGSVEIKIMPEKVELEKTKTEGVEKVSIDSSKSDKVILPEKVEPEIDKKFYKGSIVALVPIKGYGKMVVHDVELELQDETKNVYKLKQKEIFLDPIVKKDEVVEKKIEEISLDNLEKGNSDIVVLIEKTEKEFLADLLKARNIGSAFDPKDLLVFCEDILKKQPDLKNLISILAKPSSKSSTFDSPEKIQETLENTLKALATICDSTLVDNKKQKEDVTKTSKWNKCLTGLTVISVAVSPFIGSVITNLISSGKDALVGFIASGNSTNS